MVMAAKVRYLKKTLKISLKNCMFFLQPPFVGKNRFLIDIPSPRAAFIFHGCSLTRQEREKIVDQIICLQIRVWQAFQLILEGYTVPHWEESINICLEPKIHVMAFRGIFTRLSYPLFITCIANRFGIRAPSTAYDTCRIVIHSTFIYGFYQKGLYQIFCDTMIPM